MDERFLSFKFICLAIKICLSGGLCFIILYVNVDVGDRSQRQVKTQLLLLKKTASLLDRTF